MNDLFRYPGIMVIPALLILMPLCFGPVSAAYIDITATGNISNWTFTPGLTNINATSVHLTVTSDAFVWTVSAKDASDDSKPPSYAGHMVEWNGAAYVTPVPKVFGTAMTVSGTNVAQATGTSAVLSGSDQVIESDTEAVSSLAIPLTFSQPVAYTDPHLTGNHLYRIVVTFTGTAEQINPPIVTSFGPPVLKRGSTQTLLIFGSGFQNGAKVKLTQGAAVINGTYPSGQGVFPPARIVCTVTIPSTASGKWNLVVTNPDYGVATIPNAFTIV